MALAIICLIICSVVTNWRTSWDWLRVLFLFLLMLVIGRLSNVVCEPLPHSLLLFPHPGLISWRRRGRRRRRWGPLIRGLPRVAKDAFLQVSDVKLGCIPRLNNKLITMVRKVFRILGGVYERKRAHRSLCHFHSTKRYTCREIAANNVPSLPPL